MFSPLTLATILGLVAKQEDLGCISVFSEEADLIMLQMSKIWPEISISSPSDTDFIESLKKPEGNMLIYSDNLLNLESYLEILKVIDALGEHLTWIFPDSVDLTNLPLRLDSNVVTLNKVEENQEIKLFENYKVKQGPLITIPYGLWRANEGLTMEETTKWSRRKDLGGAIIVDTVLDWYPALVTLADGTKTGMIAEALKAALSGYNASLAYTSPEDKRWGGLSGEINETTGLPLYVGMVGMLQRQEADTSTAGLTVTSGRSAVMDFSVGVIVDLVTLIHLPTSSNSATVDMFAFLTLFNIQTWQLFVL